MYREPGKPDKYIIDDRVIVKRTLQLPKINWNALPPWAIPLCITALSPLLCSVVYKYIDGPICGGLIISLIVFGIFSFVFGISKADLP